MIEHLAEFSAQQIWQLAAQGLGAGSSWPALGTAHSAHCSHTVHFSLFTVHSEQGQGVQFTQFSLMCEHMIVCTVGNSELQCVQQFWQLAHRELGARSSWHCSLFTPLKRVNSSQLTTVYSVHSAHSCWRREDLAPGPAAAWPSRPPRQHRRCCCCTAPLNFTHTSVST